MSLSAVVLASLAGSLHCAGMCSGFAMALEAGPRSRLRTQIGYHGGRLVGYLSLGGLAGASGWGLSDLARSLAPSARPAFGIAMGLVLLAMGLRILVRGHSSGSLVRLRTSSDRWPKRLFSTWLRRPGWTSPLAVGLLTAVLPCGWLWGFVVAAAATADVGSALAIMAAFWLGTVPALFGAGLFAKALARRLGRHAPRITGLAFVLLGVLGLAGKLTPNPESESASEGVVPCHH